MCICVVVVFFFLRNRLDLTLVTYQKEKKRRGLWRFKREGIICIPLADSY